MTKLNKIEPTIKFTHQQEINNTEVFLDIVQMNNKKNFNLNFVMNPLIRMIVYIFIHIITKKNKNSNNHRFNLN